MPFYTETAIILPRQARDKHRESTPKKRCDFVLQEMGYKLFETFTLSTGSIKTVFSLATTVFLMPLWTAGARYLDIAYINAYAVSAYNI
jgi:hypothetical protein